MQDNHLHSHIERNITRKPSFLKAPPTKAKQYDI